MMLTAPLCCRCAFFGVWSSFHFHLCAVESAASWMRCNRLEWLNRLIFYPQRFWRRSLVLAPRFTGFALVGKTSQCLWVSRP